MDRKSHLKKFRIVSLRQRAAWMVISSVSWKRLPCDSKLVDQERSLFCNGQCVLVLNRPGTSSVRNECPVIFEAPKYSYFSCH